MILNNDERFKDSKSYDESARFRKDAPRGPSSCMRAKRFTQFDVNNTVKIQKDARLYVFFR